MFITERLFYMNTLIGNMVQRLKKSIEYNKKGCDIKIIKECDFFSKVR